MSLTTPLVRTRDLGKTFRLGDIETTAVRGVTLDIRCGELALLMGPSGSGKTTLLCLLSGLLRRGAGSRRHGRAAAPSPRRTVRRRAAARGDRARPGRQSGTDLRR